MLRLVSSLLTVLVSVSLVASQTDKEPGAKPAESGYSESQPSRKRPIEPAVAGRTEPSVRDKAADTSEEVVKVETDLVTVPVSVIDHNGSYVSGLKRSDFRVFEDGQEQEIAYFASSDKPFTVVLMLDTSPSTEYRIEQIRQAATAFVDLLGQQDRVMVIEFDANMNVLAKPTGDRKRIYKAINKADFGGGTSIYDAVAQTLEKRLEKIDGRKAIVLFTDGVDTTSKKADYSSAVALAEESDTVIYPVYYNTFKENFKPTDPTRGKPMPGTSVSDYIQGQHFLEDLAAYTGGKIFVAGTDPGGLKRAFESIAAELRQQYSIGYVPRSAGAPGERHQIKVRIDRPGLVIRARDSYVAGRRNEN